MTQVRNSQSTDTRGLTMRRNISRQKKLFLLLFIVPSLVLYLIFYIWPFIYAFYISVFDWSGYSKKMTFCGFDNYVKVFRDPIVWSGLKHNLYFLLWSTIVIFVLSLFFAVCVTRLKIKCPNFFRIVYFFPNTLSIIVVGVLWMFIYNPSFGLLNGILETLGLDGWVRDWLGDKNVVMGSLIVPQAWMYIGFYMVLFISAIQGIPEDYYEAATLDGAGQFRQFFSITVPLIWGTLRTALVFFVVNAFARTFALVYVVTEGGPNRASELMTTYLYEQAFQNGRFGYGAAIGVLLFAIVCAISMTIYKLTARENVEY